MDVGTTVVVGVSVVVGRSVVLLVVGVVVDVVVLVVEVVVDVVVVTIGVVADSGVVAGVTARGSPSPGTRNAAPATRIVTSPANRASQRTLGCVENVATASVQRRRRPGSTLSVPAWTGAAARHGLGAVSRRARRLGGSPCHGRLTTQRGQLKEEH